MKTLITCTLIILLSFSTFAKDKTIDFKQKKGLKPNEGLVVLIIDINLRIAKISVAKEGKIFPVYSFKNPRPGVQIRIIKLKEGTYYWKEGIGYSSEYRFDFNMKKEITAFTVKSGKLNFPGTLKFNAFGTNREKNISFNYNLVNNSTSVFEYLKNEFEELTSKYPLVYSGANPDPFLQYTKELKN